MVLSMLSVSDGNNVTASAGNKTVTSYSEQPWFVLSAARHYDLHMSQDPAISHFYSFEANQSEGLTFAIPDGCVDILFDCDDARPDAQVCGSPLEARHAVLKHKHSYFGVRFAMGVVPDFLDVSAEELVNHEYGLLETVPGFEPFFEQIVGDSTFSSQVELFNRFYSGKMPRKTSDTTLKAVHAICQQKGDIRIKELENLTGYSSRTLQRQFQADMGMSPKAFSRIVRCQSAVHEINHQSSIVFSELASDLGFSDQPHFLREFKKLVSTTPMNYQRRVQQNDYLHRIRYA